MFNFFISPEQLNSGIAQIQGKDFNHIKNVLRMEKGEKFLVSVSGVSHLCSLKEFTTDSVICEIIEENYLDTALPINIHLFQGLPKSDKLELIIQKAVELGVTEITPVEMARSIVKLEPKKKKDKTERWQAIAESSAKQSKRTIIPTVHEPITFKNAISVAKSTDLIILPFECANGMDALKSVLAEIKQGMTVSVFIGPEGGFDESEVQTAIDNGARLVSLGKRILRTETASILTVGALMLHSEMNL